MNGDELVFRFVGYDELSDTLRDIARNLEKVVDNSQKVVDRMVEMGSALALIGASTGLTNERLDALNRHLERLSDRSARAAVATSAAAGGIGAMGLVSFITANPIVALTVAIVALTLAVSGLLPVVGVFVALLIPFALGIAAVGAAAFITFGALAGLAVGVVLLADALFKAGLAVDPLLKLETALKNMALTLGQQAYPIAIKMLNWALQFLPIIQRLASAMITWFGTMLPAALNAASAVFGSLYNAINQVGPVLGAFIEHFLNSPALLGLFGAMISFVADTVVGLLQNLQRLADFFVARLPAMTAIMSAGFTKIGSFIQWLGDQFAKFVDFLISVWPRAVEITTGAIGALTEIIQGIRIGFELWGRILGPVAAALRPLASNAGALVTPLTFLRNHMKDIGIYIGIILPLVTALVIGILAVAAATAIWTAILAINPIVLIAIAIIALIGLIGLLVIHWNDHNNALRIAWQNIVQFVGNFFSALGSIVAGVIAFFASLVQMVEDAWHQFASRPAYWIGWLIGFILGFEVRVLQIIFGLFTKLVGLAEDGAARFVRMIGDNLWQVPGILDAIWNDALATVGRFFSDLGSAANQAWDFVNNIRNIMYSMDWWGIGRDIVFGIGNGLSSLAGWLWSKAWSLAKGALDGAKEALGIGSPSIVSAQEVGKPVAQGIGIGFADQFKNTLVGMQGLMGGAPRQLISAATPGGNRPVNINQQQRQQILLKIDNDVLAQTIIQNISRWREITEHV